MQSINTKIQIVINERIWSKQRIVISDVCITNNLYRWAKLQKFPFDGFEWRNDKSNFDEKFRKNYDKNEDKGHMHDVDVAYTKNLHDSQSDLLFLPERVKINCAKFVWNFYNKEKYIVNRRILKQTLNHWVILKRVHSNRIQSKSMVETIHWYSQRTKKKGEKMVLRKTSSSTWTTQFLERLWKILESMETPNLRWLKNI